MLEFISDPGPLVIASTHDEILDELKHDFCLLLDRSWDFSLRDVLATSRAVWVALPFL